jgi:hypothetical protein
VGAAIAAGVEAAVLVEADLDLDMPFANGKEIALDEIGAEQGGPAGSMNREVREP